MSLWSKLTGRDGIEERGLPEQSVPVPPASLVTPAASTPLEERVLDLLRRGKEIDAIKLYRAETGFGLKEAKDAVQDLERGGRPSVPRGDRSVAGADAVDAAIRAGRLIEAIKLHREATGMGLKESKEAVEARRAELGM